MTGPAGRAPVDPSLAVMLEILRSPDAPRLASGDVASARANFRTLTVDVRRPWSIIDVPVVEDVTVDGAEGPLPGRVYRPAPASAGPLPTIVFFHGGGFVLGDLDTHDNQCRWICREVGAVVLSVAYRPAPENRWPGPVDDCLAATRWAAAHIDTLGADTARLAVGGDSAGGNLAAVVAQDCRDAGGPALAAQLLVYPATDFAGTHPSREQNAEGYFLTVADMLWFDANYLSGDADRTDPRLSPLHGRLDGLPPAVVTTAGYDPLRDEGDAYAAALAAAGVPVVHLRYDGLIHGFLDLPPISPTAESAVQEVCAALRTLLT